MPKIKAKLDGRTITVRVSSQLDTDLTWACQHTSTANESDYIRRTLAASIEQLRRDVALREQHMQQARAILEAEVARVRSGGGGYQFGELRPQPLTSEQQQLKNLTEMALAQAAAKKK